jgi:MFS family permease
VNFLVVLNVYVRPFYRYMRQNQLTAPRTNCVGRLVAGRIADIYGRINILIILVVMAVILIFTVLYPFSSSLVALYLFCGTYGFVSGSFICLAPVCVRQISPAKEIGMKFGTLYGLVAFA